MEIVIGRDPQSGQLKITVGTQSKLFGASGSVPTSVSRRHCSINIGSQGNMKIRNLTAENVTYVNGTTVETKVVSTEDTVELGKDKYILPWEALNGLVSKTVDARHLEKIWYDFSSTRYAQQVADRRFNALRSVTGIITMTAIALTMLTGAKTTPYIIAYAAAILLSGIFTIKAWIDAKKVPEKNKKLVEDFETKYVCPSCHRFLGNVSYTVLKQNGGCNHCKTRFKF